MALVDLKDAWGWIRRIIRRIERLESGAFLERSSITNGRMRFIGGTLRGDSGATLDWVGLMQIVGSLILTGAMEVNDDGSISLGGITITRDVLDVAGGAVIQVGDGVTLTPDSITVNADGTVTIGDIVLSGASGGSFSAPVKITLSAPLVEVIGALNVSQAAVFDGTITAPNLLTTPLASAPSGAFIGAVYRDGSNRLRVVVP